MKYKALAFLSLFAALTLGACKDDPHTYHVPDGVGVIRYSDERGIYREGQEFSASVEKLWLEARVAFEAREYSKAIELLQRFRFEPSIVDSARALDAVMLESVVKLESGRKRDDGQWALHDLANAWLDSSLDAAKLRTLPATMLTSEGTKEVRGLGTKLADSGKLEESFKLQRLIFEHYSNGLGAVPSRMYQLARETRNNAWFAYLAGEYELAIQISQDLLKRAPRADIRSTTQLVLAQSYVKSQRFKGAVRIYQDVFETARDPDLREEALFGQIQALVASSKGWEYNREPYELALEKLTEYKTGFLTVYRDAKLVREFADVERQLHDVLYRKDKESAKAYDRLFEESSKRFYLDVAGRRRDTQIKSEETLRKVYLEEEADE